MIALLAAAAMTASWTPLTNFQLSCQGTQTATSNDGSPPMSLPWADTYTVDLTNGLYCEAACAAGVPIASVDDAGMTLQTASSPAGAYQVRYTASPGALEVDSSVAGSPDGAMQITQTGSCALNASGAQVPPPAAPVPSN